MKRATGHRSGMPIRRSQSVNQCLAPDLAIDSSQPLGEEIKLHPSSRINPDLRMGFRGRTLVAAGRFAP